MDTTKNHRLQSLDALRGFDMFWIAGGSGIFIGLSQLTGWSVLQAWERQLEHVPWDGFMFFDMIFPLFLFLAGVSFPFSLKKRENKPKSSLYFKIIKRGLILFFFGLLYNGLLNLDFAHLRVASVLGRIGLAWMFAALLFINTKTVSRVIWCFGLILAYWLLTILIAAPDYPGAGNFTPEGNIAAYIDRILLPGRLNNEIFDPEGILGIIPAISTALLGMLSGQFVLKGKQSMLQKAGYLTAAGAGLVIIALVWNVFYPINKSLWSSSFVCLAGGLSVLLFALFYLVIDVWGWSRPFFFFRVIGLNSITIYMATRIINFDRISAFFFQGIISLFPENWSMFLHYTGYVTVVWLFMYFLYKQKIFLKV